MLGRFGNLDDYRTTIKLLFVECFDSLFGSLFCGEGNEAIASRAVATLDDLSREAEGDRNGASGGAGEFSNESLELNRAFEDPCAFAIG